MTHARLSILFQELLRTGGRSTTDPASNSGDEIQVEWADAPRGETEPWVRLFDPVASSWVGPYSIALARLEALPDEEDEGGGWQRVWDKFPAEEYTLEEDEEDDEEE